MWGSSSSSSLCAWSLCGRCKRGASRGSGWVGGISVPAPRAGVPVRAFVRRSGLARSLATMWGKYLSDADDAPFSVRKKWTLDTDFDNLKKNVREQRAISTLAGRRLVFRGLSRKVSRRTSDREFKAGVRRASERPSRSPLSSTTPRTERPDLEKRYWWWLRSKTRFVRGWRRSARRIPPRWSLSRKKGGLPGPRPHPYSPIDLGRSPRLET